jgi:gamma-glutamyltranspeptidase/glutathione hydrolase
MKGVVAAGHPETARAGADALRDGGNAVDAAVAACLASWACEPLLTGPGAGGYLLVAGGGVAPTVLDFFVAAPSAGERAPLVAVDVSFGDAVQLFHVGGASAGVPGTPAGLEAAAARWGRLPLARLAAPGAALARHGVALNAMQAYIFEILEPILRSSPEAAARFAPGGRALRAGERFADPELAETIERLGAEGAAPFVTGDLAAATVAAIQAAGGTLTAEDLAGSEAIAREPVQAAYRDVQLLTNPPPAAGGALLAIAVEYLERHGPEPPDSAALLGAMAAAQAARTPDFDSRLGSTTHVSVVDEDGLAASVTCTNGEGSGVVVPGTGIHVNNVMGEEDLNPQGFFRAPPGRRMPSMMAPTALVRDGEVELTLGSAGSNRIRSAILQTVVAVVDHGLDAAAAVRAPRLHLERETVYAEPGVAAPAGAVRFAAPNLFFGGVQAVTRDPRTGALEAGADPRRGGAVEIVA